jgi:hypothetical protein
MDKGTTLVCPELSDPLSEEKNSKAEVLIVKPPSFTRGKYARAVFRSPEPRDGLILRQK